MARNNTVERYSFVSFDAWESVKDKFPRAVGCGDSKIIQYASPSDSVDMMRLVESSGLELVHYSKVSAQMIISAIEIGIDKIYNCNHDVALAVVNHFKKDEVDL